jgi:HEAT repeats
LLRIGGEELMKALALLLIGCAALAGQASELPVSVGRARVREVVDRLREDAHADVSFVEGDESSTVVIDAANLSVEQILRAVAQQVPSYRYEVIAGHPFLYDGGARWQLQLDNVDLRNVPRERALADYAALLRRRAEFAKLIPPGHLGVGGAEDPNDPLQERVTLQSSATVIAHLAQLLGPSRRMVIDVRKFQWGTEITDGITFDLIAPLAFDPPVYGETAPPRWRFAQGSYDLGILLTNGFAQMGLDTFLKALDHPRPAVREAGIDSLAITPKSAPRFKAVVRKLLGDPSLAVRLRAAEALLNGGETTGFSTVLSAARDARDPNVRLAGIAGLARFAAVASQHDAARKALAALSKDPDPFVRGYANAVAHSPMEQRPEAHP